MTETPKLARTLGLGALIVYAVGDILGAGIYGLVGKVAGVAGHLTWAAFAVALLVALVTALSYAELVSRFPHSGGAAHFCHQAFHKLWLTQWVGWLVFWSGVISLSTATVAFCGYFATLGFGLPKEVLVVAFVTLLGFINFRGMKESSTLNFVCTGIELSGLLLVLYLAGRYWGRHDVTAMTPTEASTVTVGFDAVLRGAALAFFAFIGFEDLANVAEESHRPERNIPIAAVVGLFFAGAVFMSIAWIAPKVLAPEVLGRSSSPLLDVVTQSSPGFPQGVFAGVAMFAVANTALLNFIMASRLLFGMASEKLLPRQLTAVHKTRQTPHVAILCVYALVMVLALVGPLEFLAATTSCIILTAFCFVHVSLFVVKRREKTATKGFRIPAFLPPLGLLLSVGLILFVPAPQKLSALAVAGVSLLVVLVAGRKAVATQ